VTLGTFTGEVDLVTGTFSVRSDREAGPSARTSAVIPESSTTVTIANSGASWNSTIRSGQCGGAPVTGANVVVTQRYPSPTFLGAVYAEITAVSTTGVSACNSVVAPTGLGVSAEYGLWSHGSLAWVTAGGATTSATTEWNFTTASATRFTFSGRIVAMVGTQLTGLGSDPGAIGILQDTGTRMVYGPMNALNLQFIKYDGTSDGTSTAALPAGYAYSLAVDSSRIWFGTYSAPSYVGYMNVDGSGTASSVQYYVNSALPYRIRIDPTDSTRAFFVYTVNAGTNPLASVRVGSPPTVSNVANLSNSPTDFTFGANGNLFIASASANAIWEYTTTGTLMNTYSTASTSCLSPYGLAQTSDGALWFTAPGSNNVCTLLPTGPNAATITVQGACANGREVVKDESGNVWAACLNSRKLVRFTPGSSATLTVGLPVSSNLRAVATSSGLVWSPLSTFVFRIAY
jgi:hypothetical protein